MSHAEGLTDELAYFDRQIDTMWFYLKRKDKGEKLDDSQLAEWAKHTRNCYLRIQKTNVSLRAEIERDYGGAGWPAGIQT